MFFTFCTPVQISLQNVVKIADFGVSKEGNMITGTVAGTPAFLAPEVIRSTVYDNEASVITKDMFVGIRMKKKQRLAQ